MRVYSSLVEHKQNVMLTFQGGMGVTKYVGEPFNEGLGNVLV
jgi:hypothetical protein